MSNWTKASELRKEASELYRKAQWQAKCLANEGHSSAEIDVATNSKMTRIAAINIEVSQLMQATL